MKQTRQIRIHILYSVQCYHCKTSHFSEVGSIMMWPTKQAAVDAAIADGWEIYLRNRLFCPRCIANQQHLPPSYRKKKYNNQ